MYHEILFLITFQPLKNVKTILSLGAVLKQVVGWIWPGLWFADACLMAWVSKLNTSPARILGMGDWR